MTIEYRCDICDKSLKMDYGAFYDFRPFGGLPVGVAENKYPDPDALCCEGDVFTRDFLEEVGLLRPALCQDCLDSCLATVIEELIQIRRLTQLRNQKIEKYLESHLKKDGKK